MTTATGGNMRCEISQKAMSLLPSARLKRRPIVCSNITKRASPDTSASGQGTPASTASATSSTMTMKSAYSAQPRLVLEARQRIGGHRAEQQRQRGADDPHHDRVDIRAYGIVAQVHQDIVPVVERGLVVNERYVEGAAIHLYAVA